VPEWLTAFSGWLLGLGPRYGVNPVVFAALYVGSIPFFFVALAWTIRRIRSRRPAVIPALITGFFFLSAYLYVLVFGHGLPWWVYPAILALVSTGAVSAIRRARSAA